MRNAALSSARFAGATFGTKRLPLVMGDAICTKRMAAASSSWLLVEHPSFAFTMRASLARSWAFAVLDTGPRVLVRTRGLIQARVQTERCPGPPTLDVLVMAMSSGESVGAFLLSAIESFTPSSSLLGSAGAIIREGVPPCKGGSAGQRRSEWLGLRPLQV